MNPALNFMWRGEAITVRHGRELRNYVTCHLSAPTALAGESWCEIRRPSPSLAAVVPEARVRLRESASISKNGRERVKERDPTLASAFFLI